MAKTFIGPLLANGRKSRSGPKKGARISKPAAQAVTNIVNNVLTRELETKYAAQATNYTGFNSGISLYSEAYPALPVIGQATAPANTHQRVGDSISPMSCTLSIDLAIAHISRTTAMRVHLWVLTRKDTKTMANVVSMTGQPLLFSSGSGSPQGYNGLPTDSMRRLNFNDFTVLHHKTHVLVGNVGYGNEDTTAGNAPNTTPQGTCVRYNLKIPCPKTLKYAEGTGSVYPTNYAPFFFVGYEKVDGSAPDIANRSIVASWVQQMTFKDA